MEKPSFRVAVIMERAALDNRWQSYKWQVAGVLADLAGTDETPRTIVQRNDDMQRIYPGFELTLHCDEAEGYFLNLQSGAPRVFVMWRLHEDRAGMDDEARPLLVTLSYNEGARWMDAQEKVDSVPILAELHSWLAEYVEANYRPEKKQRIRPKSFESKEGRYKSGM
jgi:Protein of unknown function (DUF3305)